MEEQKQSDLKSADALIQEFGPRAVLAGIQMFEKEGILAATVGTPGVDVHVRPGTMRMDGIRGFWWENRTCFLADVDIAFFLQMPGGDISDDEMAELIGTLWVDLEEDVPEVSLMNIAKLDEPPVHHEIRLDKSLVPWISLDEVEELCRDLLHRKTPQALEDPGCYRAMELADALGLRTRKEALGTQAEDACLIIAPDTDILPDAEPGTILLNTSTHPREDFGLEIYRCCYSYEYHYLFFRLQEMKTSLIQVETEEVISEHTREKKTVPVKDSRYYAELQAFRAAYALMMPANVIEKAIDEASCKVRQQVRGHGYRPHMAYVLQCAGEELEAEYQYRRCHIRTRLKLLGYIQAKGVFCRSDDGPMEPFSFDNEALKGSEKEIAIGRAEVIRLFEEDKWFHRLTESGEYVYLRGMVVRNTNKFIEADENGYPCLSSWANAHADACALIFRRHYDKKQRRFHYGFGEKGYTRAKESGARYEESPVPHLRDMLQGCSSFGQVLTEVMRDNLTIQELCYELALEDEDTVKDLLDDKIRNLEEDLLVSICLALHLPPELSAVLVEKSGIKLSSRNEALRCLFYLEDLKRIRSYLGMTEGQTPFSYCGRVYKDG